MRRLVIVRFTLKLLENEAGNDQIIFVGGSFPSAIIMTIRFSIESCDIFSSLSTNYCVYGSK
jgi:hypothetical protein